MHIRTPTSASVLIFSCIRSLASLMPPLPRGISMHQRLRREVARRYAPSPRVLLEVPPPVGRLARSSRLIGRIGRCSPRTHLCMSLPNPRLLEACLAAQRACLPQLPRHTLQWPQTRPPSPSQEPLALRSARPCNRVRPASHRGCGAWRGRFWRAAGDICARSETARLVGRWVEATRAVHSRLRVVCELAWPRSRLGELRPGLPIFGAPRTFDCECRCSQSAVS